MKPALSAADITVPSSRPPIAIDVVMHRVRQLLDGCGTSNRNDLAVIAVEALIEAGVNTGPSIVGAARSLGFRPATSVRFSAGVRAATRPVTADSADWTACTDCTRLALPDLMTPTRALVLTDAWDGAS